VSGLVRLDGTNVVYVTNIVDNVTNYFSYIELDCLSPDEEVEGFYNPDAMPSASVYSESRSEEKYTADGNAIIYVHSNPSDFNLLGDWQNNGGYPPYYYFANNVYGFQQNYAAIIQGPATFTFSYTEKDEVETESQSITIKGSGDVDYDDDAGVISGTVIFNGKGPIEIP